MSGDKNLVREIHELAVSVALEVGAFQKERSYTFRREEAEYKQRKDLVTEVDRESERRVCERVLERFPNHSILGEEEGSHDGSADVRWIVDPLDGTTNFVHGYPHYNVSIGVEIQGELTVGVVYDPSMDELFAAQKGGGSFLNGRSIHVSGCRTIEKALLATGFASLRGSGDQRNLRRFNRLIMESEGLRRAGAAALDLCYVAAGRLDGYWEDFLKPWDMAAGALIVREAGGRVGDHEGGPDFLEKGSIAAAPPELFEALHTFLLED